MRNEQNERAAKVFCEAIKELASKPENLDNLENYLSCHFQRWMEVWADTPEALSAEMREFAQMVI